MREKMLLNASPVFRYWDIYLHTGRVILEMKEVVCIRQHDAAEGGHVDQCEDDSIVLLERRRTYDRKGGDRRKGATVMDILVRKELA